ncbi:MAG: HD domain-containing protein, partial [Deltaproteobacteria bacterium]|nr:HD domain-containing protein [Deltaproteobacteria bacterium]
ELSTLYSINESLDEVEGVEPVFTRMTRLAAQSCDARTASAYLWEADTRTLVLHSVHPKGAVSARAPRVRAPGVFVELMRKSQDPRRLADPMGLATFEPLLVAPERPPTSAVLAPLFVRGEAFGVLCVEGKFGDASFGEQDLGFVKTILKKAAVMIERAALYDTIQTNLVSTLTSLVRTLEAKDPYTRFHSDRVTNLAMMVGREMGATQADLEVLRFAGLLHDIGKIGVSDAILQKKGSLTPEEFEAIKAHPIIGERILEPLGMLPDERAIIRHHHERWDGRGYPDGLAGKDIPFLARVLTLADSYDAMTSDRVYRLGLSHDVALGEVVRYAGRQFDPNVVAAFESLCRRHAHDLLERMNAGIDKELILTQRLRAAS